MHKQQIDQYIVQNEKRLKNLCFKICRGNSIWEDLFQEFYLAMLEANPDYFDRYPMNKLCNLILVRCYKNRGHNKALKSINATELLDIFASEPAEYTKDIQDIIQNELNRPHGFAPVMVFVQSMDESLHSIKRKTGINMWALSGYRKQGQERLRKLIA